MSLQVWLPLTKDTRNQGLSEIVKMSNTDFTLKSGGKLGSQCQDLSKLVRLYCADLAGIKTFSYAFWYKPETSSSTLNWNDVIAFYDSSGSKFRLETSYSNNYILSMHNNSGYGIVQHKSGSYGSDLLISSATYSRNTWYHVAVTVEENKDVRAYINGELKYVNDRADGSITGYFNLGESDGNDKEEGSMNDLRIYDHALSPMEVKQISQGLVLHYPLNRNSWGQENLLKNSGDLTLWNKESGINCEYDSTVNMYKIYSTTRESSRWGIYQDYAVTVNADTNYTFSLTGKTDGYSAYLSFGAGTGWPANHIAFTSNKQRLSKTLTIPAGTTNIRVYLAMYPQTGGGHVYFEKPKLEENSIATPWCPNSADELATTMGVNDGIEYDCSGFGNNGTKNNITYTSDSSKYAVSSIFNGTNSYIKVNDNNWMVKGMSEMTVNLWAKATTWPTNGRLVSCTESGGFNLEGGNSGYWRFPIYVYTNSEKTSSTYKFDSNEIRLADLISNEWNMITLVYDSAGTKTYINGELHHTYTNTSYGIDFNTNARLFLGCEANAASPSSPYFGGKMSDFRIYATALSASDVLSLYQNSAYIDSSGNVYGAVHTEA